jgi:hypothetical protein
MPFIAWKKKIFMFNLTPLVFPMCLFNTPFISCCHFVIPCQHSYLFVFLHFLSFVVLLSVFFCWQNLGYSHIKTLHWSEFRLIIGPFKSWLNNKQNGLEAHKILKWWIKSSLLLNGIKVERVNIFNWCEKRKKIEEEKIFTHFDERVVKRDKIKCIATKSCVEVILKDCQMPLPTKF